MADCTALPEHFTVVGAASSYSALAGVAAGVIFTGIVLLVGSRATAGSAVECRRLAIETMVPTFFVLILACFFFGELGGEGICRRASLLSLGGGQILALGATAMFQAIAWMLRSFDPDDGRMHDIAGATLLGVTFVSYAQIVSTIAGIQTDYGMNRKVYIFLVLYLVLNFTIVSSIAFRWVSGRGVEELGSWWVAGGLFLSLLLTVLEFDIAGNSPSNQFLARNPPLIVTISCATSLGILSIILPIILLAAPKRQREAMPEV